MKKNVTFVEDCPQRQQCINKYMDALFMAKITKKLSGVPNCGSCKYNVYKKEK